MLSPRQSATPMARALIRTLLLIAVSGSALAQTQTWKEGYKQVIPSSTINGLSADTLFGDEVSLYTGELSFTATDISLPGNNSLDVSLRRRLSLNDTQAHTHWEIDLPHLEGVYPENVGWTRKSLSGATGRCSSGAATPPNGVGRSTLGAASTWDPGEFWSGDYLAIPGVGSEEILKVISGGVQLPTDGGTYKWVTKSGWRISCLPVAKNNTGEGFLAVSPAGVKYYFDWFLSEDLEQLNRPAGIGSAALSADGSITMSLQGDATPMASVSDQDYLARKKVKIFPSKVVDRFGNQVDYTYGPYGLTSISSTDGRSITVGYTGSSVTTATAGGRTWSYSGFGAENLTVTLPDNSKWIYSLGVVGEPLGYQSNANGSLADVQTACDRPPSAYGGGTATVQHPSGAVGTFTFAAVRHGRSYVDRTCMGYTLPDNTYYGYAYRPYVFDTRSLRTKTISGAGLTTATWQYNYGPPNNSWASNCSAGCVATKFVDVINLSSGVTTRHTFSNRYQAGEGKELVTEVFAANGLVARRTDYTYLLDPTGQPYPARIGMSGNRRGDFTSEKFDPLLETKITQEQVVFKNHVNAYDGMARPVSVTKSRAPQ